MEALFPATPDTESRGQPQPTVSEKEMRISLCKLLHRHKTRFSNCELPAPGPRAPLADGGFSPQVAVPSGAPPAHTCDLHSFLLVTLQF